MVTQAKGLVSAVTPILVVIGEQQANSFKQAEPARNVTSKIPDDISLGPLIIRMLTCAFHLQPSVTRHDNARIQELWCVARI